jgi:ribosomal protein S21
MVVVTKQSGESDDRLIARFRKKVLESKILLEHKEHSRHRKDSEKRAEKKKRIKYLIELEKQRNY